MLIVHHVYHGGSILSLKDEAFANPVNMQAKTELIRFLSLILVKISDQKILGVSKRIELH